MEGFRLGWQEPSEVAGRSGGLLLHLAGCESLSPVGSPLQDLPRVCLMHVLWDEGLCKGTVSPQVMVCRTAKVCASSEGDAYIVALWQLPRLGFLVISIGADG